jgi:hypothetical protein
MCVPVPYVREQKFPIEKHTGSFFSLCQLYLLRFSFYFTTVFGHKVRNRTVRIRPQQTGTGIPVPVPALVLVPVIIQCGIAFVYRYLYTGTAVLVGN